MKGVGSASTPFHISFSLACRQCKETAATVANWTSAQGRISASCQAILDTLLIWCEGKQVFDQGAFLTRQAEHRSEASHPFCKEALLQKVVLTPLSIKRVPEPK